MCGEGVGEDGVLRGGVISVTLFDMSGGGLPLPVLSEPDSKWTVLYVSAEGTEDAGETTCCCCCFGEFPASGLFVLERDAAVAATAAACRHTKSVKCQSCSDVV